MKYNLDTIEFAMELCEQKCDGGFTCCLLYDIRYSTHYKAPERLLHERIFECVKETFHCKLKNAKESTEDEKLRQIRLLALAFTYEIARLKNNKKAAGF